MFHSLRFKLIAAFLGVSLVAIALVALFGALAAANEFNRFVSQEATNNFYTFVTDYYTQNGSLAGIDEALRLRFQRLAPTDDRTRMFPQLLTNPDGVVVIGFDNFSPGDRLTPTLLATGTRITANSRLIAIAVPRQTPFPRNRVQDEYLQRTGLALSFAGIGAAVVAVLLGIWLAQTITRPVRALTTAAQRMAKGDLGQSVRVASRDEVGDLADAFNQMSADLARADRTRRQMTADIAHELRNPLTVIGGYLDAMRTGDLMPTPARLEAVYDELQHLEGIVEDLRTLSLADAGALVLNRQPVAVDELLQRVSTRFAPQADQKEIALTVQAPPRLRVQVDEARMTQVLDNLLSNALKHTPAGGSVHMTASLQPTAVRLTVADTGLGIAPEDLPRVFERFYRVDKARSEDGSSGLGLAIAKALVEAHGGQIWAESAPGHGATFLIELPRAGAGEGDSSSEQLVARERLLPAT